MDYIWSEVADGIVQMFHPRLRIGAIEAEQLPDRSSTFSRVGWNVSNFIGEPWGISANGLASKPVTSIGWTSLERYLKRCNNPVSDPPNPKAISTYNTRIGYSPTDNGTLAAGTTVTT